MRAVGLVEGSQARYELSVACRRNSGELRITTFEPSGTDAKRIQWSPYGPEPDRRIRLRIDSNPAFAMVLKMHGYANEGQVKFAEADAEFEHLVMALNFAKAAGTAAIARPSI